jgi:hypothetical protein
MVDVIWLLPVRENCGSMDDCSLERPITRSAANAGKAGVASSAVSATVGNLRVREGRQRRRHAGAPFP